MNSTLNMALKKLRSTLSKALKFKVWKFGIKSILFFLLIAAFFVFAYFFVLKDIPSTATIGTSSYPQSTNIYDRRGELLYTFYANRNQTFVPLSKTPKDL